MVTSSWFDQFDGLGSSGMLLPNEQPQTPYQTKVGTAQPRPPDPGNGNVWNPFSNMYTSPERLAQDQAVANGTFVDPNRGVIMTANGGAGGFAPTSGPNAPAAGGISMQDPQAYFNSLFPGGSLSPQELAAKEAQLQQAGIRLLGPNAAGQRTKIELPNGQIVDVIGGAGSGRNARQWLVDNGGGTGGGTLGGGFQTGMFTGGGQYPLASVMGTGLMAPWTTPFQAPDPNQIEGDPSFKFQMKQGADAIQRSAASKGTLLTGGTLKDLEGYAQGLAHTFDDKYYNRALGEYQQAYNIFNNNGATQFNRLGSLANVGQTAAGQLGQYGSGYAQNAGNLITGAGNAAAAGQIGSANAIGGAVSNIGNMAGQIGMYYGLMNPQNPSSYVRNDINSVGARLGY